LATTKKPTSRTAATRTTKKPQSTTIKNRLAAAKAADARENAAKPAARSAAKPAAKTVAKPAAAKSAVKPASKAVAKTTAAKPAAKRPAAAKRADAVKGASKRPVAAAPKQRKTAKAGNVPTDIVEKLRGEVKRALEELKAKDVVEIDVRGKTSIADYIVVASGTSTRHVKSVSDEVVKYAKKIGVMPLGVEGQREAEWVLVDLGDIVVHVMLPRVREFYGLERMWTVGHEESREAAFG
jgi:ribosome silencing factor RsfS/YbeB/iojap